jgi:hypothetical protein
MKLAACVAIASGLLLPLALGSGCSKSAGGAPVDDADAAEAGYQPPPLTLPAFLPDAKILVMGHDVTNDDCRTAICRHNENVDMTTFQGAIFLVHRTAESQVLGPNSSLHVYRSDDQGATFVEQARIEAPPDRDLRDPSFFEVNGELRLKALTRLPVVSDRDSNVDTTTVMTASKDGKTWSALAPIAPGGWSFWRVKENLGVYYSAAYQDGDKSVVLYTSKDGATWTAGPQVYGVAEDTPLETELTFMPDGHLLALVRMDGLPKELLGDDGRLRTKICWASPPAYDAFTCPDELDGQRLDGPVTFWNGPRLFVIARKHLQGTGRKRTSLFELTGDFSGGKLAIKEWGELPSAGDTSYAGIAALGGGRFVTSWYSGDLVKDGPWILEMLAITDIWKGTLDLNQLK